MATLLEGNILEITSIRIVAAIKSLVFIECFLDAKHFSLFTHYLPEASTALGAIMLTLDR